MNSNAVTTWCTCSEIRNEFDECQQRRESFVWCIPKSKWQRHWNIWYSFFLFTLLDSAWNVRMTRTKYDCVYMFISDLDHIHTLLAWILIFCIIILVYPILFGWLRIKSQPKNKTISPSSKRINGEYSDSLIQIEIEQKSYGKSMSFFFAILLIVTDSGMKVKIRITRIYLFHFSFNAFTANHNWFIWEV